MVVAGVPHPAHVPACNCGGGGDALTRARVRAGERPSLDDEQMVVLAACASSDCYMHATVVAASCLTWRMCGECPRSDDQHMVALGGMEKEELRGLDIAIFSRAPPEAMLATLEHLRRAAPDLASPACGMHWIRAALVFWRGLHACACACGRSPVCAARFLKGPASDECMHASHCASATVVLAQGRSKPPAELACCGGAAAGHESPGISWRRTQQP